MREFLPEDREEELRVVGRCPAAKLLDMPSGRSVRTEEGVDCSDWDRAVRRTGPTPALRRRRRSDNDRPDRLDQRDGAVPSNQTLMQ